MFQTGLGFTIKTTSNTNGDSLKYPKTANPNSSWVYIWEGLLSEGYLHQFEMRGGGLFFKGVIFRGA